MNKKMIILIITLVIIIIPNKIKAYELETESGYEYSKTLPESGYTYHHTECNGTKVKEENVTYNEEAKTFNINGITEQNNCKFYFNKNGEEIIRTYEVKVTVLNGTIEGETRKVIKSNENVTFSLNPTSGYGSPTVTCTNNQTGNVTNNTLTVSNVTNDTVCTVEFKKTKSMIQSVTSDYSGEMWAYKDKITKIKIEDSIHPKEDEISSWDISEAGDGSVIARIVPNTEDTSTYIAYIQGDGKIIANKNSSYLFYYFDKTETIEGLENLDTSEVTNMKGMFASVGRYATTLNLDVSSFDTSNVETMEQMFLAAGRTANSVNIIGLNNFVTSNVRNMHAMFEEVAYASNVVSININNWDTRNVTDMSEMFYTAGYYATTFNLIGALKISDNCNVDAFAASSPMFTGNIVIEGELKSFVDMFNSAATIPGSRINLIYNDSNESLIDNIISLYGPSGTESQGNIYKLKEAKEIYRVSVVVNNGTIDGDTIKAVNSGDNTIFTVTSNGSNVVQNLNCTNGQTYSFTYDNTLTVSNVTSDTVCTITFLPEPGGGVVIE